MKPGSFDNIFLNRQSNQNVEIHSPPLQIPENTSFEENIIQNNPNPPIVAVIPEENPAENAINIQMIIPEADQRNEENNLENHGETLNECLWNILFAHLIGIMFISSFLYKTHYVLIFVVLFFQDLYDLSLILPKAYIFFKNKER